MSAHEDFTKETFVIRNSDGSFSLDPLAGKSRDELKTRCGQLSRALNKWQFAAMNAATSGGNKLDNVSEQYRSMIANLIEVYTDE